jgi:hypothetical protein
LCLEHFGFESILRVGILSKYRTRNTERQNTECSKYRKFEIPNVQNTENSKYRMFKIPNVQNTENSKYRMFKIPNVQNTEKFA